MVDIRKSKHLCDFANRIILVREQEELGALNAVVLQKLHGALAAVFLEQASKITFADTALRGDLGKAEAAVALQQLNSRTNAVIAVFGGQVLLLLTNDGDMTYKLTHPKYEVTKKYKTVFIMEIGYPLTDGVDDAGRAPDYDDWSTPNEEGFTGLNGDLLIWYPILERSIELSSMGIRVNQEALQTQLKLQGKEDRSQLYFHKRLLEGSLPLSIGGGIGQSRLCMILLHKAHIGETQSSIWPCSMREECQAAGMHLI